MSQEHQYIIITSGSHTATELSEFDTAAINTMKYASWNVDNTKYILKCSVNTPPCFVSHTRYNKTEIETVLGTTEWKTSNSNKVDSQIDTINSNDIANTPNSEL